MTPFTLCSTACSREHRENYSLFDEQVMRKRPYIKREWCEQALRHPLRREVQPNGLIRHRVLIPQLGRYLRVVTLEDSMTVHNAFLDRNFTAAGS